MMTEGMAHDIYNLVASILGNAALVRQELGDAHPAEGKLDAIERAAERAADLTKQILTVARGKPRPAEPANLNTVVYHVLLVEEQQLAPRIRIARYIDPDLRRVAMDAGGLAQLTYNLAINAVESIPGKGRVDIRTRNIELADDTVPQGGGLKPGRYVLLSVEDSGSGMDADALAHALEPGFTTKSGKSGMGLAEAQRIVAAAGGHLTVGSVKGQGTAVRAYLPAYETDEEYAIQFPPETLPAGTETILIVDDERMVLDVTREALRRLGYRTLVAQNGQEAVDIARTYVGPIHLVLLDMAMPVMGGAEAYPLLKEIRPEAKVIICTGLDQDLVTDSVLEKGSNAFLLKPFRATALAQEIRRVLDGAPAPKPAKTGRSSGP